MFKLCLFNLAGAWPGDHWNAACLQQNRHGLKGIQNHCWTPMLPFFKNHLNHSRLLLFCALTYSFCVLLHPSLLHLTHKINVLYAWHFDPMRGFKSVVLEYSIKFTRPKSKHTITVSSFTFILCSLVALTYILCWCGGPPKLATRRESSMS